MEHDPIIFRSDKPVSPIRLVATPFRLKHPDLLRTDPV
jgi:hypothetical protein